MLWRVVLLFPVLLLTAAWSCAALWIDGPESRILAGALAFAYVAAGAAVFAALRPFRRALLAYAVLFLLVVGWWRSIPASNDREWLEDVSRTPTATFAGDQVVISNVRNFDYESELEYTPRWEERTYDLSKITGVDLFLSYWGSPLIAHTIMSWEFEDGEHLAISIETRKEVGEEYSAVLGFFRQFELYYVVADERDLVRLRTNYRGEQVRLYRLTNVKPEGARAVLEQYLHEIDRLNREARWYNAATHNCTTAIRYHIKQVAPDNPWDWRILVNGLIDEMAYERGSIDTSLAFEDLRAASDVGEAARAADDAPDFSARIRDGLPGF
ncbi:MAG: DUF4105 domain-containing protein [Myxococcota bacterium]